MVVPGPKPIPSLILALTSLRDPLRSAWKKEVWEGSMPVGPEGMNQSTMEFLSTT